VRHFGRVFTFAVERAAGEIMLGSANGSSAHPALRGPCALQRRLCTLYIGLIPASCDAGDVVPVPSASSRRPPSYAFPRCSSAYVSAALVWHLAGCVAVGLSLATGSWVGD
jgi:hypothetical protein